MGLFDDVFLDEEAELLALPAADKLLDMFGGAGDDFLMNASLSGEFPPTSGWNGGRWARPQLPRRSRVQAEALGSCAGGRPSGSAPPFAPL